MKKLAWLMAVAALALNGVACDDGEGDGDGDGDVDGDVDGDADGDVDGDVDGDADGDTDSDADADGGGNAALSFVPKWGSGVDLPTSWTLPGRDGDDVLVIMLCETTDASCEDPVVTHEVTEAERVGNEGLIQNSFGPTVTVEGLPAGDYLLMVFADSLDSRERGYGWDDGFETGETAWGGVVSETDWMLADSPASGPNPDPAPLSVTLVDGETEDLGDLFLNHFHERNISPTPDSETGTIVVATENGVRIIDLSDFSVRTAYEVSGTPYYDYIMVDDTDEVVDGRVCGMVRGEGSHVYLLFKSATTDIAGFAVEFDAATGTQVSTNFVTFPGGGPDNPCRGAFHQHAGQSYLWVTNVGGPEAATEGLWYANVTALSTAAVDAGLLGSVDDDVIGDGIDQIAALEDTLYLASVSTEAPCTGRSCVFLADFDATTGEPTLRFDTEYEALVGPEIDASVTTGDGDVPCGDNVGYAGLAIARFHDDRDLLFLGGCLEITVWDLGTGDKLDYNGAGPGSPGLDGSLFGQAFVDFDLSPDGTTLYAMPAHKSLFHFNFQVGTGDRRQTFDRHMIFPVDLSSGDIPEVHADFATTNIDDWEGLTSIGERVTPAIDPGIDVRYAYRTQYQVYWAPDTAGATPSVLPVGPTMAAAAGTVWFRGSGITGVSGLGWGGNLGVCSVDAAQTILWPRGEDPFFPVWLSGPAPDEGFGFDLTPESTDDLATYQLLYMPGE